MTKYERHFKKLYNIPIRMQKYTGIITWTQKKERETHREIDKNMARKHFLFFPTEISRLNKDIKCNFLEFKTLVFLKKSEEQILSCKMKNNCWD